MMCISNYMVKNSFPIFLMEVFTKNYASFYQKQVTCPKGKWQRGHRALLQLPILAPPLPRTENFFKRWPSFVLNDVRRTINSCIMHCMFALSFLKVKKLENLRKVCHVLLLTLVASLGTRLSHKHELQSLQIKAC